MKLNHLSIITPNMPEAITFFRDILELRVEGDEAFAEVQTGGLMVSLMSTAMVPTGRPQGVILQFEVDNVPARVERVLGRGGRILRDSDLTIWGTESAFVAGPDGLVVELYRWEDGATEG